MTDIEIPEGFTRWDGGEPVHLQEYELIHRDGRSTVTFNPAGYSWAHLGDGEDIIAYRIVS